MLSPGGPEKWDLVIFESIVPAGRFKEMPERPRFEILCAQRWIFGHHVIYMRFFHFIEHGAFLAHVSGNR
jgi:hypothetical protein